MPPKFRNPKNLTISLPASRHHHCTSAPSPLPPPNVGSALSPPSPSPPLSHHQQRPHSEPSSTCDSFRRKRRVPPHLTVRTDHNCVSRNDSGMALPPTPARTVSRKQASSTTSPADGSVRNGGGAGMIEEDLWGSSENNSSGSNSASNTSSESNSEMHDEYDDYDHDIYNHNYNHNNIISNDGIWDAYGDAELGPEVPRAVDTGYGDGPIQIYDAGLWLYTEPTREVASQFDVVINVAKEVPNPFDRTANEDESMSSSASPSPSTSPAWPKPPPEYIHVPWGHSTPIIDDLPALCQLIHTRLSQNKRVLVHCQFGISRSASLVVAYGLYRQRALQQSISDFHEMYDTVKSRSRNVGPNMHLIYELMEFRKQVASGDCDAKSQRVPDDWFWRDPALFRNTEQEEEDKENLPQSPRSQPSSPSPPARLKTSNKSSSSSASTFTSTSASASASASASSTSAPLQEKDNRYSSIISNREMHIYPPIPQIPTDLHSPVASSIFNTPALFTLLTSKFCA